MAALAGAGHALGLGQIKAGNAGLQDSDAGGVELTGVRAGRTGVWGPGWPDCKRKAQPAQLLDAAASKGAPVALLSVRVSSANLGFGQRC